MRVFSNKGKVWRGMREKVSKEVAKGTDWKALKVTWDKDFELHEAFLNFKSCDFELHSFFELWLIFELEKSFSNFQT